MAANLTPLTPEGFLALVRELGDEDAFLCDFGGQTAINAPNIDRVFALGALSPAPSREARDRFRSWVFNEFGITGEGAWTEEFDRLFAAIAASESPSDSAIRALDAVLAMMEYGDKGDTWPDMIDMAKFVIQSEGLASLEADIAERDAAEDEAERLADIE